MTDVWSAKAKLAISQGANALMSFNEPDVCYSGSACMSVADAVTAYKAHMQPFAGKALLGAPAVTNGAAPYGLTWLQQFMTKCTGCRFDFIVVHWYSNHYAGATYFESFINDVRKVANGKPIWVTEFGLTSDDPYTEDQLIDFLETVMPWMDQQSDIHRYAYFMDEAGALINSNGKGMSTVGKIYNSFYNNTKQAYIG